MSVVMDQLSQDHIHIARLLDFIDMEVAKAGTGQELDIALLRDIMEYVTTYPDVYHHPLEDQLFTELRGHPDASGAEIDAIQAEHSELMVLGRTFLEALDLLLMDEGMRVDKFVAMGRTYTTRQRRHLRREERGLFRLARETLTAAEWAELDAGFARAPDPVFGQGVKRMYQTLSKALA